MDNYQGSKVLPFRERCCRSANIFHLVELAQILKEGLMLSHLLHAVYYSDDRFVIVGESIESGDDLTLEKGLRLVQEVDIFLFTLVDDFNPCIEKRVPEASLYSKVRLFSDFFLISIRFGINYSESNLRVL